MDHEIVEATASNSGDALRGINRLRASLQTLPFFGSGKVIWFQGCNYLGEDRTASSQSVTEAVNELAAELKTFRWDGVRLLISAGKVHKGRTFYKTLDKAGVVEIMPSLSADDRDWAAQAEHHAMESFKAAGKSIDDEALGEFVASVGPNLRLLHSEAEKLVVYLGARSAVTPGDVSILTVRNKQARAFALADAVGDRDLPRALKTLDEEMWEMKTDKDKSFLGLLAGVLSKMRVLLMLKELVALGHLKPEADYYRYKSQLERLPPGLLPEDKRYNLAAMNAYISFKALPQVKNYTREELVAAMDLLLTCNQRLVSSSLDDALVFQQTLVEIIGSPVPVPRTRRA